MAVSSTKKSDHQRGSLVLEVILAVAVFGLYVGSLSGLLATLQSERILLTLRRQALYEAVGVIGRTMNAETTNNDFFSILSTATTTVKTGTTTTGASTAVDERLLVQDLTPCTKSLTSFVSWQNNLRENSTSTIALSLVASNPTEDVNLGGDCEGDEPHKVWSGPIAQTLPGQNPGTLSSLDANNGIMVAVGSSSNSNLIVFQYEKGLLPTMSGSVAISAPAADVDLAGTYAYLAANSSTSQLRIANVSNPNQPTIVSSATLPGVAGSYPGGLSVVYYDSRVYVGTHRTAGREFHVYDDSVPPSPVWLGSIELNHNINQIIVRDNYAYLATSGNTDDIIILDISNPTVIKQVASLTFAGSEDTVSIFLIGNTLYAGRKKGSSASHPEFYVINVTNPTSPAIISSFVVGSTVASIKIAGNLAFLATDNPTKTLMVLDVRDPFHIANVSSRGLNLVGTSIDYENDTVFLAASSSITMFTP